MKKVIAGVVAVSAAGAAYLYQSQPVIYGDEVRVRLYRGMGGKLTDHATYGFGEAARKKCGVRFYVESGQQTDKGAFSKFVREGKLVIFVGTSLGGYKAREHAAAFGPQHARLLLIDPVPWTKPIPKNVGNDHVVWRNTAPFQLGGGKPQGTVNDRPSFATHGWLIHRKQTHDEVVTEICRGVTKRPEVKDGKA